MPELWKSQTQKQRLYEGEEIMKHKGSDKFLDKLSDDSTKFPDDEETEKAFKGKAILVCMNRKMPDTEYSSKCYKCGCKVYYSQDVGVPKKFLCNECFYKMIDNNEKMQINVPQDTIKRVAESLQNRDNAIAG